VGLTALAGSLAAVTAQAGELSVTGSANVTYVTKATGNTAQSLGHDKDVKFSGSGELDNGWTFAIHTLSKDDLTVSSTATVLTMGSLGSIGVGSGVELISMVLMMSQSQQLTRKTLMLVDKLRLTTLVHTQTVMVLLMRCQLWM
jgi:hypothetical protein